MTGERGASQQINNTHEETDMSDEQDHGVIQKYTVRRRHDPSGKHDDCWFFVLDIKHDPLAREALAAYAVAAREAGYLALYADLTERLAAVQQVKEDICTACDDDLSEHPHETVKGRAPTKENCGCWPCPDAAAVLDLYAPEATP